MMNTKVKLFCEALDNLNPKKSDGLIADLYDIVDLLEDEKEIDEVVYESVFNFFEKYPEEDVGNPRPLVHLVERFYPDYMPSLFASEKMSPTYLSVVILNRVLNSELDDIEREKYLLILKSASKNYSIDEISRDTAQELYEYQMTNRS